MKNLEIEFDPKDIKAALDYVQKHWDELERYCPQDSGTLVGLPHPYYVSSDVASSGFVYDELYYWDTYFMALGLIGTEKERAAFGLVDDIIALIQRFGMAPNGGRLYLTSRSQPPFLTSLIMNLYEVVESKKWLSYRIEMAKLEYENVWMGTKQPHWRQVFEGLSRYYDTNVLHELAECESGWDMTTRFGYRCLDFIPIDLNTLLYKYEKDFSKAALILGKPKEAEEWFKKAEKRKATIDKYLWNETEGFYFDYDFKNGRQGRVWSLAGFYPLWTGMVSPERARRMVQALEKFEGPAGLTATAQYPQIEEKYPSQWTYPNGWAPLHFLVIRGLAHYGYELEAERIARKWIGVNLDGFKKHGAFFEKYNVIDIAKPPKDGVYPPQIGFGWTNAVFYRLSMDYLRLHELPQAKASKRQKLLKLVTGSESWHRTKVRTFGHL